MVTVPGCLCASPAVRHPAVVGAVALGALLHQLGLPAAAAGRAGHLRGAAARHWTVAPLILLSAAAVRLHAPAAGADGATRGSRPLSVAAVGCQ